MSNLISKQTTGLVGSSGFSGIRIAGIGLASILGVIVTYSMIQTNTLQSKLMRLQILKLNKEGIMEQESALTQAFDKIDALAGIYKAPVIQNTPAIQNTNSADGRSRNAASMIEGDPAKWFNQQQRSEQSALKEYTPPVIGGGFGNSWKF